ncbi:MAG TPA: LysR family transcriptional regulator [Thermomonospora sp.]|nr:LysR family transcriptional regulator [Thermomonospora sp.]
MELREVEAFLTVAEELHFARAAGRLGVTPGRVSQMIRALEREIGAALFERTSRRVRLTPLGERFRARAGAGYDDLTCALLEARTAARNVGGTLRVGLLPGIGDRVTPLVAEFEARHPCCEVVSNTLPLPAGLIPSEPLESGEWDVVVAWAPWGGAAQVASAGIVVGPALAECPRAVLVPRDDPLARRDAVSLDDLTGRELLNPGTTMGAELRDHWLQLPTRSGRPLRYTGDDMVTMAGGRNLTAEDMMMLVARGRGLYITVTTLLERFPHAGLAVVPIVDAPPKVLAPMWMAAAETATIRAFAALPRRLALAR